MMKKIEKIINLSDKRINHLHNIDNKWFYKWYKTYIKWINDELKEAIKEIKENNSVYLEDELWDVFWGYICLVHSLEQEWLINKENVFERCYKKFKERLSWSWDSPWNWEKVKNKQKLELKKEQRNLNN